VHVRYENFHFPVEAASGSYHLSLHAFAAIEHYLFILAFYQNGWQVSAGCWNASARS
jgi:hypothetical protein